MSRSCQCEHEAHFDRSKRTPYGNPAHKYGIKFAERVLVRMNNSYEVCQDCAEDCRLPIPHGDAL